MTSSVNMLLVFNFFIIWNYKSRQYFELYVTYMGMFEETSWELQNVNGMVFQSME